MCEHLKYFMAVAFTCFSADVSHAQNILINGGFEDGANGWESGGVTTTTSSAYSGTASGVASLSAFGYVRQFIAALDNVRAGQVYRWSAYMRVASGTSTIMMRINQTDSSGGLTMTLTTNMVTTTWTRFSAVFKPNIVGELSSLSILFAAGNAGMTLYLDEVYVTNASPPLSLSMTNESFVVSWPVTGANYALHGATNFVPLVWVAETNSVQTNAGIISATLPATRRFNFYRLQTP